MSINSINQNLNWPDGATSLLVSGKSNTGTYTYPTTLTAGIYAVKVASLNKDTTGVYVTATANGQTETILNNGTGYLNLASNETSLVIRPTGAAPTTFTSLYAQAGAAAPNGTFDIVYGGGNYVLLGQDSGGNYAYFTAIGDLYGSWNKTFQNTATMNGSSRINYGGGKFVGMTLTGVAVSTNGITWTETNILGTTGSMQFVDYTNGIWIASANNSSLYTSTDTVTWNAIYGNFTGNAQVNQGIYANSKYTLVGASATIASATTNLRQWVSANSNFGSSAINSIFYGNSLYVIGGAGGAMSSSTDAVTWTLRTSGFGTSAINEVVYGNGIWVAAGAGGALRSSTDAITWTARTSSFATSAINGVAYGAGLFVAVGAGGRMTTSTDAITWNGVATPGFGTSAINYVTYTNGLFVAVGAGGRISSSTNGSTWTGVTAGTAAYQAAIYYNGNYIVAGSTGNIWASTDLITWAQRTSNSTSNQFTLVSNGTNQVFAAGTTGFINPSTDGVTWSGTTYGNPQQNPVYYNAAYGAGKYLVGSNSTSWPVSTDGVTWTAATGPTSANVLIYGAAAGFVMGDGSSLTYASTDAVTWSSSASLTWATVQGKLTYYNGYYLASSNSPSASYYWYSTNGLTWTSNSAGTSTIGRVIWVGNTYITSDTNAGTGIRVSSTINGTWANYLGSSSAVGIAVNGNTLVTAAATKTIKSTDAGTTWSVFVPSTYTSGTYQATLYAAGYYILSDSSITQASTDLVSWYSQSSISPSFLAYGQSNAVNYYVGFVGGSSSSPLYYNDGTNFTSGWTNGAAIWSTPRSTTGIGFIGNRLFAGASGAIAYTDSLTQSVSVETLISNFTPYAFAGYERNYYAFGNSGLSYFSTNGTTWASFPTGFGNNTIRTASYSNGIFTIAGSGTRMAFSTDGITWTQSTTGTPTIVAQNANNNQYYFAGGSSAISIYSASSSYPMMYSIYGVNPNTI